MCLQVLTSKVIFGLILFDIFTKSEQNEPTTVEHEIMIKSHLRQKDIAARYGGEEFLILLPETGIEGAKAVAQKIKKALSIKK